jgi:hypothetical protein
MGHGGGSSGSLITPRSRSPKLCNQRHLAGLNDAHIRNVAFIFMQNRGVNAIISGF